MPNRTCSHPDCGRPHSARDMCSSHYGTWHRKTYGRNDQTFTKVCAACEKTWTTTVAASKYCSVQCKGDDYRRTCKLPADHPVIAHIKQAKAAAAAARAEAKRATRFLEWRTPRQCPGCACWFSPIYTPNAVCCSTKCSRKVSKQRRRAREHNARGEFTWAEFMRIARKFNYCCAYCGDKPERLDPDHVVPLSRGGTNTPSNLLPCCFMCNSSKNAMLLHEWATWLAERGHDPRHTTWAAGDPRYAHLTDALLLARVSEAA